MGGFCISQSDHKLFVDHVLIPAVSQLIPVDSYPIPLDFEHAARFGVGQCALRLSTYNVNRLVDIMRSIIVSNRNLGCFSGFFLSIIDHGEKSMIHQIGDRVNITDQQFLKECLSFLPLDWDRIITEQLWVDFALVFRPPSALVASGLWKDYDYIRSLFFDTDANFRFVGDFRKDDMCGFLDLGGFKYSPKGCSKGLTGIVSMQCYCLFKHIDFKRNNLSFRQSKDITPSLIVTDSKGIKTWVDNLSRDLSVAISKKRSYGVRIEFRVSALKSRRLIATLHHPQMILKLSQAIKFYPTKAILGFIKYRLMACNVLYSYYSSSLNRSTFSGLTFAAAISYLFGTLLHRPLDSHGMKSIHELLCESRLADSRCLFLPEFFVDEQQNWGVVSPLHEDGLVRIFGAAIVATCRAQIPVNVSRFVNINRDVEVDRTTGLNAERVWEPPSDSNIQYRDLVEVLLTLQRSPLYRFFDLHFPMEVIPPKYKKPLSKNLNFQRAANIIMVFGMGSQGVALISQIIMTDLVLGFTSWENKLKDQYSFHGDKKACTNYMSTKVCDHLFKQNGPATYLKPDCFQLYDQANYTDYQLNTYFLPSFDAILEDTTGSYLQAEKSNWKTLGARAYIIFFISQFGATRRREVALFRTQIVNYILSNYAYIPRIARDKIYNNYNSSISFMHMPPRTP